jgi:hypothetical protein
MTKEPLWWMTHVGVIGLTLLPALAARGHPLDSPPRLPQGGQDAGQRQNAATTRTYVAPDPGHVRRPFPRCSRQIVPGRQFAVGRPVDSAEVRFGYHQLVVATAVFVFIAATVCIVASRKVAKGIQRHWNDSLGYQGGTMHGAGVEPTHARRMHRLPTMYPGMARGISIMWWWRPMGCSPSKPRPAASRSRCRAARTTRSYLMGKRSTFPLGGTPMGWTRQKPTRAGCPSFSPGPWLSRSR